MSIPRAAGRLSEYLRRRFSAEDSRDTAHRQECIAGLADLPMAIIRTAAPLVRVGELDRARPSSTRNSMTEGGPVARPRERVGAWARDNGCKEDLRAFGPRGRAARRANSDFNGRAGRRGGERRLLAAAHANVRQRVPKPRRRPLNNKSKKAPISQGLFVLLRGGATTRGQLGLRCRLR
jgi:hypothetical protein